MPDMYAEPHLLTHFYAQTCWAWSRTMIPSKFSSTEAIMIQVASLEPLFVNVATEYGTTRNPGSRIHFLIRIINCVSELRNSLCCPPSRR